MRWWLTLFVLGATSRAWAIDPGKPPERCAIESFGARDGLAGWVRDLAQTADGYLYLATSAGLFRYGGGAVVAIDAAVVPRAGDVTGLLAAKDGTLWVSPARGGPACLRGGRLEECLAGETLGPATRIEDLHQDDAGAIWIASSAGVHRVSDGRLTRVYTPADRPLAVHRDRAGTLRVGTSAGLLVERDGALVSAGPSTGAVTAFFETRPGRLWAVADDGLLLIEGGSVTLHGRAQGFPGGRPRALVEDRDGNVWRGGRTGLLRFRPGEGFVAFAGGGLPDGDVTALFEDREGGLWVATRAGGVAQLTDRTLDADAGPPSLRDRWINTLAEDRTGTLWVGTRTGLVRWHPARGEALFTRAHGLPADGVLAVAPDPDGLWIGTEAGLARLRDGRITTAGNASPVTALYHGPDGTLYVGSDAGLSRRAPGEAHATPIPSAPGTDVSDVRGMGHDDHGVLWLASSGRLLRVAGGRIAPAPDGPTAPVRGFARDRDGTLWLATRSGLVARRAGAWRSFGAAEGLAPADLYQVIADNRGDLWAGGALGIVRIGGASLTAVAAGQRPTLEVASFTTSDRRRTVEVVGARQPMVGLGHDGRIWFATGRGMVTVDPTRVRRNDRPPEVRIERALVDGRPATGNQRFPPGAGALEFHFGAITLIEPHKARHRYRLEGFDRDWIDAGDRRVATYTNIGPGAYRFRVEASNADGVWNQAGDAFAFVLDPPLGATWWFRALLVAAVLGLALAGHRLHVAGVRRRYAAALAERTRISRELHDSLLQGMTGVKLQLAGLRKRLARPAAPAEVRAETTRTLSEIEAQLGASVEETRRYIWDLRADADDSDLAPALDRLVSEVARRSGPAVHLATEGRAPALPPATTRELVRIVKEALANALAHAGAEHIEIRMRDDGRSIHLTVHDDGRGFDPAAAPGAGSGHFGIVGMRERAAAIGGFRLESRPGAGTTIEVTVPHQETRDV